VRICQESHHESGPGNAPNLKQSFDNLEKIRLKQPMNFGSFEKHLPLLRRFSIWPGSRPMLRGQSPPSMRFIAMRCGWLRHGDVAGLDHNH
jgi:hypothetical protein